MVLNTSGVFGRHGPGLASGCAPGAALAALVLAWVVTSAAWAPLVGCGGKTGSNDTPDAAAYCENEDDCLAGFTCEQNVCVSKDAGVEPDVAAGDPAIVVDPVQADFGSPVVGGEVIIPVTIHNTGTGDLEIIDINVAENDAVPEYSFDPPASMTIPPAGSEEMSVALRPTDDEIDVGQLLITSNDPATPTVTVDLLSSWKGIVDLSVCVETEDASGAECENPPEIAYGTVTYGTASARTLYAWNAGDGNKLITVEDVQVSTTAASHDPLYQVTLFELLEDPPGSGNFEESPVTLPFLLTPLAGGIAPSRLYARVTFTANTDGFKILDGDSLIITTTNTDDPIDQDTSIPITGLVEGCPPGLVDLNGDPVDGCEYTCQITNGGVETCDNLDNDCDGFVDGFSESCYTVGDGGCDPDGSNCQGICQGGTRDCNLGVYSTCVGQVGAQTEACDDLDNDCDGVINNGLGGGKDTCSTAEPRPNRPEDTSTDSISGFIPTGDEDWYVITFTDLPDSNEDDFNAHLWFDGGAGDFRMDIYSACGGSVLTCGAGGNSQGITEFSFNAFGEISTDCAQDNSCIDHSLTLYIRVYRVASAVPLCEAYTLMAQNG